MKLSLKRFVQVLCVVIFSSNVSFGAAAFSINGLDTIWAPFPNGINGVNTSLDSSTSDSMFMKVPQNLIIKNLSASAIHVVMSFHSHDSLSDVGVNFFCLGYTVARGGYNLDFNWDTVNVIDISANTSAHIDSICSLYTIAKIAVVNPTSDPHVSSLVGALVFRAC